MPDNNFRFAFDFFFTDIPNHIEFLKWSRRLGKDDDILLVAALEAMYVYYHLKDTSEESLGVDEMGQSYRKISVSPPFWRTDHDAMADSRRHNSEQQESETTAAPQRSNLQRGQSQGMDRNTFSVKSGTSTLPKPRLTNKHPYNLIEIYANLKKLDNREFNAIEVAYLDGGWRNFKSWKSFFPRTLNRWSETHILLWTAFLSLISELAFSIILFFWHAANGVEILYEREKYAFEMLIAISVISTFVFYNIATKQWQDAIDFNSIDGSNYWTTLGPGDFAFWLGRCLLLMNYIGNVVLGPPLVLFNVYFVLTSPDPTEGILNAVALGFILEVDDLLAPSWDADRCEDAEANLFHGYISSPFPGENDQFQHMRFTRTPGPIPYKDGDKLYIKVPETIPLEATEFFITVFRSNHPFDGGATPTEKYETINYKISGNSSYIAIFHERVRQFYCLANFDDFKVHEESMVAMLEHSRRHLVGVPARDLESR